MPRESYVSRRSILRSAPAVVVAGASGGIVGAAAKIATASTSSPDAGLIARVTAFLDLARREREAWDRYAFADQDHMFAERMKRPADEIARLEEASDLADADASTLCKAVMDEVEELVTLPAATYAGLAAKAAALATLAPKQDGSAFADSKTHPLILSVAADAQRLGRYGETFASVGPAPLPAGPATADADILDAYDEWLYRERELLHDERHGDDRSRDTLRFIPCTPAVRFHFPLTTPWRDMPTPSTRAAHVMQTVGCPWTYPEAVPDV